ncbi:uncharacterized protein LOC143469124 isoform X1 [Clavelina lepadiformis]|uniref:uncharacterized protein LOC143469124 isoform X1 n=1 Tax=Clavelina lepadiformis TaxID=159417 RepID=UPI0040429384
MERSTAAPTALQEGQETNVFEKKETCEKFQMPSPFADEIKPPICSSKADIVNAFLEQCEVSDSDLAINTAVPVSSNKQISGQRNCSFSNSLINLVFDEKEKLEMKDTQEESDSLPVVDLDALDEDILFTSKSEHLARVPSPCQPMCCLAKEVIPASPIPLAAEMAPHLAKTPGRNTPQISSPFESPAGSGPRQRPFSISSTSASPISCGNIVASTPFHGRMVSQSSDSYNKGTPVDTTYNLDEQDPRPTIQNTTVNKPMDTTYDTKPSKNTTFTSTQATAVNNVTYSRPSDESVAKSNETFEIVVKLVPDTSIRAGTMTPPDGNSTFDANKDKVTKDIVRNQPPKEIKLKSGLRKPLSSLGNTQVDSRLKMPTSSQAPKRISRLQPPRVNPPAVSRIQARSPRKGGSGAQDENTTSSSMKPPTTTTIRKPQPRKSIMATRKSLLPPSTKHRVVVPPASVSPKSPKPKSTKSPGSKSADGSCTTQKRKAESPRYSAGRVAKLENSRTDANQSRASTSASSSRSNSHATSRTTLSKLHRPSASSLHTPRMVATCNATSETTISAVGVPRSRLGSVKQTKATKRAHVSPDNVKDKLQRKATNQNTKCVVAMATLLDYVVNRLDGLSAPQLSSDKQQLERLVEDQNQTNSDLKTRVVDLEKALQESRDAHTRDVTETTERHRRDVTELRECSEKEQRALQERLEEFSRKFSEQQSEFEKNVATLKDENQKNMEALTSKHEEVVQQLHDEWSDEKERIEIETRELRDQMDLKVKTKVEELIQPYINSYEENKSLRTVLEMKNSEHHKLQLSVVCLQVSQQEIQLSEIHSVRDQVTSLRQKNEDLQTQLTDRNAECRSLRVEVEQLRGNLSEQQQMSTNQQQRIEELHYRLDCSSPSPASPFNPVFTPSPTAGAPVGEAPFVSTITPKRGKFARGLSNQCNDINSTGSPIQNGTS